MPASLKTFRLPDFVPRCWRFGSQPFRGMPRSTAGFSSSVVEVKWEWEGRGGEAGGDGRMRPNSPRPDASDETRPLKDLLSERARGGVVRAEQREARPGVARGDAGEELQVVLEDDRVHRLRGHVDEPRPGVAQADEQEEQPLLVEVGAGELPELALVERERGDDYRGGRLRLA